MNDQLIALGIDQLTIEQRLELIDQIWESLEPEAQLRSIPEWHVPILSQRRAELEQSPNVAKPWRAALAKFESAP